MNLHRRTAFETDTWTAVFGCVTENGICRLAQAQGSTVDLTLATDQNVKGTFTADFTGTTLNRSFGVELCP